MERHIDNPYKVNWKMYGLIGGVSAIIMIFAVAWNKCTNSIIWDVVKNLAFGCLASTLVALFIEIGNIREKNDKAHSVYDAVYHELQYRIMNYLETWSQLCSIAFEDKDYRKERHTWIEWYEITKCKFEECDENRQEELIDFFNEQLLYSVDRIEKAIRQIEDQQYILDINGLYDQGLKNILADHSFEFYAAKLTLGRKYSKEDFWGTFDAVKQDLLNYINNWVDIRYYNYYRFKPYNFFDDKSEIMRAILESKKDNQ